jgi:hypothetical protein
MEAQIKAQLQENLCAWLLEQPSIARQPRPRLELAAHIVSWAIYGAAIEWSKNRAHQTAEAFAEEAVPLIVASISALDACPTHRGLHAIRQSDAD